MKAVVCTRYGPPEVLLVKERLTSVPRKNEVRIRILATAVASSDCYVRGLNLNPSYRLMARLALGWKAPRQPVLGMVLSGEVDVLHYSQPWAGGTADEWTYTLAVTVK